MISLAMSRRALAGALLSLAAGAAALFHPRGVRAQQVVAFDVTYTASTETTHDAHFDVQPPADLPANWVSPVDYASGTVHIHQEVTSKPSNKDTMVDICFDGDLEGYGCIGTDLYTDVGTHDTTASLKEMWQYDKVAWTKKRTLFQLIVKDRDNNNGGNPVTDYMPTTMRIVLTVVAQGGTYVPPGPAAAGDAGAVSDADIGNGDGAAGGGPGEPVRDAAVGTGNEAGVIVTPPPSDAMTPLGSGPSADSGSTGARGQTSGDSGDSGGCSVARLRPRLPAELGAMALLAGLCFRRRRVR
jgi:hypothetical protein